MSLARQINNKLDEIIAERGISFDGEGSAEGCSPNK